MSSFTESLISFQRLKTKQVKIGDLSIGSDFPIRIQSMTTTDTMDTKGTVEQSIRMIKAGSEIVRITAPNIGAAENLKNIKDELRKLGYTAPLVADIHFTPNAAEVAARIVEKVRVNPGNYVDRKLFKTVEYDDKTYNQEIVRIHERFSPLVKICKENGTAMRIGCNHGSLSDRIMSRYGDTPVGMVEAAMEFVRVCEDWNYDQIVLSMKASSPTIMVHAYRLLVEKMRDTGNVYPIHLGVTEAGEGEDGRIKSAVGIGALLADGIGDTVRVSLTEDPEFEPPVARALVNYFSKKDEPNKSDKESEGYAKYFHPAEFHRRDSNSAKYLGGKSTPKVILDYSQIPFDNEVLSELGFKKLEKVDKWKRLDISPDMLYLGNKKVPEGFPQELPVLVDYSTWLNENTGIIYPLFDSMEQWNGSEKKSDELNILKMTLADLKSLEKNTVNGLNQYPVVLLLKPTSDSAVLEMREMALVMAEKSMLQPIVWYHDEISTPDEGVDQISSYQVRSGCRLGTLLIDGYTDGVWVAEPNQYKLNTIFGLFQSVRLRVSKTEYISCPSCGRTLFDLQEVTAKIRKRTEHLKGVKIGIMGCVVNGPGEMADADFGYVGTGPEKISLYKGQEVVAKNLHESIAVDKLIDLIKENGKWVDVEAVTS